MSHTLYWFQGAGCGGDTLAWLNLEVPDLASWMQFADLELLYHPSLSCGTPAEHSRLLERLAGGDQPLDILCLEGSLLEGPDGTGLADTLLGEPKSRWFGKLAARARVVFAVGTCAAFGGVTLEGGVGATGAQFRRWQRGGFLGPDFTAGSGLPVINLAGCPCHPEVLAGALGAYTAGRELSLNPFNMPLEWFSVLVHQGCTRNEYHEYRVEENNFGEKGCLFFHMGCHGPLAHGPCNKYLWNRRSSKTRVGVPCFGCTRPDFPHPHAFFHTRNIEGIPLELPDGVDRAHYLAYKGMAAAAAPERLRKRQTWV